MLKSLLRVYPNTKLQHKDGKPLSVTVTVNVKSNKGTKSTKMIFKDSLKLIALKLDKIIKEYEIKTKKLIFPYKFMTIYNLDYCGKVPKKSFYDEKKVSEFDYENLLEEFKNTN
jgi:hypothetical protein